MASTHGPRRSRDTTLSNARRGADLLWRIDAERYRATVDDSYFSMLSRPYECPPTAVPAVRSRMPL